MSRRPDPLYQGEYDQGSPAVESTRCSRTSRARLGWTLETQRERLGNLWPTSRGRDDEPVRLDHDRTDTRDIASPSASNRMVAYHTRSCSWRTCPSTWCELRDDQLRERARARRGARSHGLSQSGADANDHCSSPNARTSTNPRHGALWSALKEFGTEADDLAHIDLYSCFPTSSRARATCSASTPSTRLESRLSRRLTFAGGPETTTSPFDRRGRQCLTRRSDVAGSRDRTRLVLDQTLVGHVRRDAALRGFRWRDAQSDVDALPSVASAFLKVTSSSRPTPSVTTATARRALDRGCAQQRRPAHVVPQHDAELMKRAETEEIIGEHATLNAGILALDEVGKQHFERTAPHEAPASGLGDVEHGRDDAVAFASVKDTGEMLAPGEMLEHLSRARTGAKPCSFALVTLGALFSRRRPAVRRRDTKATAWCRCARALRCALAPRQRS